MNEKVSVVTIVKNHDKGLVATLDSLNSQSFSNWESIIVVGDSIDDTLKEAMSFKSGKTNVSIIPQKSSGIYQAMNEGIEASSGESIIFMNAGDIFSNSNALLEMFNTFQELNCGIVLGGFRVLNQEKVLSFPKRRISSLRFAFNLRFGCHQAMIFSRKAVMHFSGYDTSFKLCADYKLVLQILREEGGFRVQNIFAAVEPGGVSDRSLFSVHSEKHQIRREFFGKFIWFPSIIWKFIIFVYLKSKKL